MLNVQAALDGTWKSDNTWGGMDTGMVKMATIYKYASVSSV